MLSCGVRCLVWLTLATQLAGAEVSAADTVKDESRPRSELLDGDRVVMLGGTFIEREGQFGYIETALTAAYPDRNITFRNLGWSGDTVWAESRGIFDPPAAGYQRMIDLVKELKPTVVLLAYGQNEAFAGEAGLEAFVKQYEKLCDDLSPTGARYLFLNPMTIPQYVLSKPQELAINDRLSKYKEAIQQLGAKRGHVIDLNQHGAENWPIHVFDRGIIRNLFQGMHLNESGYQFPVAAIAKDVGFDVPPMWGDDNDAKHTESMQKTIQLRRLIVAKNTLFFHSWRPENVT
ncbi:MAG: hypothetical protein B7Z55_17220, partial [Planctomycetales bacterium 12-60-4]